MITPINDNITTRVIPGLRASYQIVSLPYWAWFWLEDLMKKHKIGYQGIYDRFHIDGDVALTLRHLAELHQDDAMREEHNLANDNEMQKKDFMALLRKRSTVDMVQMPNLPKIYKLFGFMPCPTTLEAVWQRRYYEDSNRVK